MSGLLNQGEPQTEAPQQMEAPAAEGQDTPMSPEDQEKFDILVANGMKIIYNEKFGKTMLNKVVKSKAPVEDIASFTLAVVTRLENAMERKKISLPDGVKIQAANQLMGEIMSMCEQAELPPLSEEQRGECWSIAVSKYIDQAIKTGKMTPEQVQELSAQAQQTPEGQEIMAKMQGQQPAPQAPAQGGM